MKGSQVPNTTEFSAEGIARSDPVLRRMVKIEASPLVIGVVYAAVFQSLKVLTAWRAGHLYTTGTVTGLLEEPALFTNFVVGAAVWTYYVWMPKGVVEMFRGLLRNDVIGAPRLTAKENLDPQEAHNAFLGEVQLSFGKWWWPAMSLVVTIGAALTFLLPRYLDLRENAAWAADPLSFALTLIWTSVGVYCVLLLLLFGFLSIHWLSRLFHTFEINIRPLAPDRAGGLSPMGSFTLKLSYLIAILGIMLVITPMGTNYIVNRTLDFLWTDESLLALVAYAVAAPLVFFAPLSVAHNAMKDAKDQKLLQIAQRFNREYAKLQEALNNDTRIRFEQETKSSRLQWFADLILGLCMSIIAIPVALFAPLSFVRKAIDKLGAGLSNVVERSDQADTGCQTTARSNTAEIEDGLKVLKELQTMHDMTRRFPVWPFNVQNITRFSTSYISPIALAVSLDLIGKLL